VQFEKDEEDPFQVDKLFQDAKLGGKRSEKHDKYVCLLLLLLLFLSALQFTGSYEIILILEITSLNRL